MSAADLTDVLNRYRSSAEPPHAFGLGCADHCRRDPGMRGEGERLAERDPFGPARREEDELAGTAPSPVERFGVANPGQYHGRV